MNGNELLKKLRKVARQRGEHLEFIKNMEKVHMERFVWGEDVPQ